MIIVCIRKYYKDFTQSDLYINGERFCYVLEDEGRPSGVKIPDDTCIPEGCYQVAISVSHRFKKPMMVLYNRDDHSIERLGVRFTGIRPHGGNNIEHTAGCPLLAYNSDHNGKVWNRASDDLQDIITAAIDKGEEVKWIITEGIR